MIEPALKERGVTNLMSGDARHVLILNGGSSSIRFALYVVGESLWRLLRGKVERIGLADSFLTTSREDDAPPDRIPIEAPDFGHAVGHLIRSRDFG
jgi:acetate kinase